MKSCNIIIFLTILFLRLPLHAFQKSETELFTFYYNPGDRKAASVVISEADAIAEEISENLGFMFSSRITVYIVPTFKELQKVKPSKARIPRWAIGVAFPSKNLIILLNKRRVDLIKTFRHEVNHILLGQAFKGKQRVPRWLDEGLAMIQAGEWSMSRLSSITSAVLTDSLIPMDDIVDSFPEEWRDAELAYCQSFYFISFLKGTFGDETFKTFLNEYSKHKNFPRAIRSAYNMGWENMEELWLDYLKLRFSWIPIITSTGTLWFAASLIFIAGYLRKKRKTRKKLRQWALEESLLYGDKPDDSFE